MISLRNTSDVQALKPPAQTDKLSANLLTTRNCKKGITPSPAEEKMGGPISVSSPEAERVGFDPTMACTILAFQASALGQTMRPLQAQTFADGIIARQAKLVLYFQLYLWKPWNIHDSKTPHPTSMTHCKEPLAERLTAGVYYSRDEKPCIKQISSALC